MNGFEKERDQQASRAGLWTRLELLGDVDELTGAKVALNEVAHCARAGIRVPVMVRRYLQGLSVSVIQWLRLSNGGSRPANGAP